MKTISRVPAVLALAVAGFNMGAHSVRADAGHAPGGKAMPEIGMPGKPGEASRTVEIKAGDNFFEPERVDVAAGETIRFVIRNAGKLVHEFNIGTPATHLQHQEEMKMMMEHGVLQDDRINHGRMKMDMGGGKTMEHNDPNSVLLEPGKTGEIVWTFTKAMTLEFACNIPGHYQVGMAGIITVVR